MAADEPTVEERLKELEERVQVQRKHLAEILAAGGPEAEALERALRTSAEKARAENIVLQEDIDRILARLDTAMPEAQKQMDELLARLRVTRIVEAA